MKILITGVAGYIGTVLTSHLLKKGYQVYGLDNLMYGGNQLLPYIGEKNFTFQRGDIRNIEDVKRAVQGKDVIVHLAAIVGYPACRKYPELAKQVNVGGSKNLIKATSQNQLILYASTGSNYGTVDDICIEETPLKPLSLYGQTKTLAEYLFLERRNTIVYRFATGFGVSPRMRLDLLINDFTYRAVTEGYLVVYEKHFKRTFIHVCDIARAILFGLKNQDQMKGEVYNVGSDRMNYSKEDICNILLKKTNLQPYYAKVGEDQDKRNYEVSYKKIHALGYDTTISAEEGIDELIAAYQVIKLHNPYSNI